MVVETRAPRTSIVSCRASDARCRLRPRITCHGEADGACRFLIVQAWACTTLLRSVDELGSLALPRVRAVAQSPGAPTSVGRFGESLDYLPRSQTETRRALGQTEGHESSFCWRYNMVDNVFVQMNAVNTTTSNNINARTLYRSILRRAG